MGSERRNRGSAFSFGTNALQYKLRAMSCCLWEGTMLPAANSQVLSTDVVSGSQRVAYWRDAICDIFVELDCDMLADDAEFYGKIINRPIAHLQFSDVMSAGQHVRRSAARIGRSDDDYFLISLQTAGQGMVIQDGRIAKLNKGDFALYDSMRPYELKFDAPFSQFVARIPRSAVANRLVTPEWLTARRIDGSQGVGRVALSYLAELERQLPALDDHASSRLCDTFLDLITLALSGPTETQPQVSNVRRVQVCRIQSYIEDHLASPDLNPHSIADAHRITVRYLNMLFSSAETSVGRWIWQRRLEKCEGDLRDPRHNGRTIGEIAYSWGFNDLTHFSRAFKSRFGMSPKDYRHHTRNIG